MEDNSHDDGISGLQVKTKTTGARRQHEQVNVCVRVIELDEEIRSLFWFGRTVEPEVLVSTIVEVVGHDVHDMCHLEEHQDLV